MIVAGDGLSVLVFFWGACYFLAGWALTRLQLGAPAAASGSEKMGRGLDLIWRMTLAGANGLLIAGGSLALASAAGLAWTGGVVWGLAALAAALAVAGLAGSTTFRGVEEAAGLRALWPTGLWPKLASLVAGALILLFAATTALRMNVHADYIYHWGQKAAKNHLAGGLDIAFLSQPWNAYVHPDYPNLLPALHAAAFSASGGIAWPATATLAVAFFALLLLALGALAQAAADSESGPGGAGGPVAAFTLGALGASAFAIGYRQAGGADLALAAAMTAAAALLARPADRRSDFQVACIAALLAAVKIEGLPAAGFLLALHVSRRALGQPARRWREAFLAAIRCSVPAAIVAGLWGWMTFHHGLFLESNTGAFSFGKLPQVLGGLGRVAWLPDWWGLPLVLLALPVLLWLEKGRRFAALFLLAQLGFYVYSYAAGPVDTGHWIDTSAPRLLFHLVPASCVMTLLAVDRLSRRSERPGVSP